MSVAVHVRVGPARMVSVVTFVVVHPVVVRCPIAGSVTVHVTVTLQVYQPLVPGVPGRSAPTVGPVLSTWTVTVAEVEVFPALSW